MTAHSKGSNGNVPAGRQLLRVLFVEDSPTDAFLLERALKRGGFDVRSERVDSAELMAAALERKQWDLILADHSMPLFSAPGALELMKQKGLDLPFIIVSGHIEEETAVSAMNAGAHDYVMKDRLGRLVPAVQRELREAEVRRARARSEEELRRAHEELEMRVQKRTAALQESNAKLQSVIEERKRLENELLEIAENERRRIGFDLHDDLGQKMTGILLLARAVQQRLTGERHACCEELDRICNLIEQALHHTHNLARHFSSLDMHGDDLATVLKGLSASVKKMFGIPCVLTVRGEIPPVSQNVTTQFYKIAQEAVSNAIKHGKATHVLISLCRMADQRLALTIRNDGVPFSQPASDKGRLGLRIMNYRANTVGAAFDIRPNLKNGTIVTCTLPLKHPNGSRHPRSEAGAERNGAENGSRRFRAPAEHVVA